MFIHDAESKQNQNKCKIKTNALFWFLIIFSRSNTYVLSVCHASVLWRDGWRYRRAVFTDGYLVRQGFNGTRVKCCEDTAPLCANGARWQCTRGFHCWIHNPKGHQRVPERLLPCITFKSIVVTNNCCSGLICNFMMTADGYQLIIHDKVTPFDRLSQQLLSLLLV